MKCNITVRINLLKSLQFLLTCQLHRDRRVCVCEWVRGNVFQKHNAKCTGFEELEFKALWWPWYLNQYFLYIKQTKESKDPSAGNKFTSLPILLLTPCRPQIIPSLVCGTVNSAGARERAAHLSSTSDASPPNEESYCLMRELINTYGSHSLIRLLTHTIAQIHILELDYKKESQWEKSSNVCARFWYAWEFENLWIML